MLFQDLSFTGLWQPTDRIIPLTSSVVHAVGIGYANYFESEVGLVAWPEKWIYIKLIHLEM